MGNSNGLSDAIANRGMNTVKDFDGGYFSLAMGDEIALCLDEKEGDYFILNCSRDLFDEVSAKVDEGLSAGELASFWKGKANEYEVSDWSRDFNNL